MMDYQGESISLGRVISSYLFHFPGEQAFLVSVC